jgi:hypothetical protein
MKIYCAHSRSFDYTKEYYEPLQKAFGGQHELIFPHASTVFTDTKEILSSCTVLLAEVSYPATGLGIEIGRAEMMQVPIIALHTAGSQVSEAVNAVATTSFEYASPEDMVTKLAAALIPYAQH